ncbi:MAG: hypothetical protein LBE97_01405 [Holosporales bacterium]|jgi:hypothetical protein|nr:hypothetical protein [Holosporales bacterium]
MDTILHTIELGKRLTSIYREAENKLAENYGPYGSLWDKPQSPASAPLDFGVAKTQVIAQTLDIQRLLIEIRYHHAPSSGTTLTDFSEYFRRIILAHRKYPLLE